MDVTQRIKLAGGAESEVVELARWVCLASRIEPHLLRRARLRFMARTSASLESDLWFGPLVQTRAARFITLYPEVADHLREEVATNALRMARARQLVRKAHEYLPELVRLEEKLVWLVLKGGPHHQRQLDARLRPILKALLTGERKGLARWAISALPRLPTSVQSESLCLVQMVAEAQLYGGWMRLLEPSEETGETLSDEARALLFQGMERVEIGIQLFGDRLEVSEPPAAAAQLIRVPATNPRLLNLRWRATEGIKEARLTWPRSDLSQAEEATEPQRTNALLHQVEPPVSLTTLAGDNYRVISQRDVIEQMQEKTKPFLVALLNDDLRPVGAGMLIGERHVITTERHVRQIESYARFSKSLDESVIRVRFPFLQDQRPMVARELRRTPTDSRFPQLENLTLLELDGSLVKGALAKPLHQSSELPGKMLMAFGHSSQKPDGSWARFELLATIDRYYALKPSANIRLADWSGSPLIDAESGEVFGVFCLRDESSAVQRPVPNDFLKLKTSGIEIFFSYSHKDEKLRDKLAVYLKIFERGGVISGWHDRQITAGSEWAGQIDERLNTARIILLLISNDYLDSDYCHDIEMKRALERHDNGEARVIPIILRPCPWERAPFNKLQALPTDARPVTDWKNRDKAFMNVAVGIEAIIKEINANASGSLPSSGVQPASQHRAPTRSRIWNVPHLRNPNFTGRKENLTELRASLLAGETAAVVQPRAIHGLGGIGKTQLAVEYAYRNGADYDIVWWLRSEDPTTLASDYASLAVKLNLPEKEATEQGLIIEAVKEWLRQHQGWLLVFDNAEDAKSVRDYIPPDSAGHVIVTSRNPNWAGVAKPLSVKTLPQAEAVEFLFKRTGGQDEATASVLVEALGCLPLALEQAGAYIETSGCTMAYYLEIFEKRQRDMMQRGRPSTEYPDTIATTWSLSFQKVERENPAAAELLRLCAFFTPDDIPLKMLTDGAKELPESLAATVADALLLDEAVMALRKYSLVEVDNETLTIHRLVQAVIRYTMDDAAFKQWVGVAVHVVNASFPEESDDVRTWPICAPLLPHASAVLSHAEAVQFVSNETARLFNQVGLYLEARAEYAEAKIMYERALAIDEAALGPNHPNVAIRLNNLGNVLRAQGDLTGAKALFERALAIDEAALGPNHPDVALGLNNLGLVLATQGDFSGAKALYERSLAIDEAALGPDHPTVAIRLNNLGIVLREQGDLGGAKAIFERALAIDEATLGSNHPSGAIRLNNLGDVLRKQGDLAGAKALYKRALFIFREFLGDDHPHTKSAQKNFQVLEEELKNEQA